MSREESLKLIEDVVISEIQPLFTFYENGIMTCIFEDPNSFYVSVAHKDLVAYQRKFYSDLPDKCLEICSKLKVKLNISEKELEQIVLNVVKRFGEKYKYINLNLHDSLGKHEETLNSIKKIINENDFIKKDENIELQLNVINELLIKIKNSGPFTRHIEQDNLKILINKLHETVEEKRIIGIQQAYEHSLIDIQLSRKNLEEYLKGLKTNYEGLNNIYDLLSMAFRELGYTEKDISENLEKRYEGMGSKNFTKYADDMAETTMYNGDKQGKAWCEIFVDWLFRETFGEVRCRELLHKYKGRLHGAGTAYSAVYYLNGIKEHAKFLFGRMEKSPRIGDQVFFGKKANIIHTGLVVGVDSSYVYVVEGNSLPQTNQVISEGRGVYLKRYSIDDNRIVFYGRPDYTDKEYFENNEIIETISKKVADLYNQIYKLMEETLKDIGLKDEKQIDDTLERTEIKNNNKGDEDKEEIGDPPFTQKLLISAQTVKAIVVKINEDLQINNNDLKMEV